MDAFEISDLVQKAEKEGRASLEFFRAPTMSLGIYCLPAGGTDTQQPHTEDEAYYVIRGRARFRADAEDRAVAPGTAVFVAAGVEHRFYDIEEDLALLVVFAPAKGFRTAK